MMNIQRRRTDGRCLRDENGWQILRRGERMVDIKEMRRDGRY